MSEEPKSPVTVTLWRVEYVPNNMGVWDQAWFATKKEALDWIEGMVNDEVFQLTPDEDLCGDYGQMSEPRLVPVELTPQGLLSFAQEYACDQSE